MNALSQEIAIMRNPVLGSILIWRFVNSYVNGRTEKEGVPLPVAFLVLPMLWHGPTAKNITSTLMKSGIRGFISKFSETHSEMDVLLGLGDRAQRWRHYSKQSLLMALSTGLIELDISGYLQSSDMVWKPNKQTQVAKEMASNAEKIGKWFSEISTGEISMKLKIKF